MKDYESQIRDLARNFINETDGKGDFSQFANYLGLHATDLEEVITTKQIAALLQEEALKVRLEKQSSFTVERKEKVKQHKEEKKTSVYYQLFRYMKDLNAIIRKMITDVHNYLDYFYIKDLPCTDGLKLYRETKDGILLEVNKVSVPEPPEPPEEIKKWLSGDVKNPLHNLVISERIIVNDQEQVITAITKRSVENWIDTVWKPWANVAGPKKRVYFLYRKLFLLVQRLDKEEDLELVWGQGMLYWKQIRHPVLTARVYLNFDDVSGKISIVSGFDTAPIFETDFIHDSELPEVDLSQLQQDFIENSIMPWDDEECEIFLNRFANRLPDGRYIKENNVASKEHPIVVDEPIVFVRRKRFGFGRDIDLILKGLEEGNNVPKTIRNIMENSEETEETKEHNQEYGDVLFPLPANNEQWKIVERLQNHTGVTVHGPPGTGKSHTIANLTSDSNPKRSKTCLN